MMHYASQGVRNAARKGSNALVHHGGHNSSGGNTAGTQTSRSIHMFSTLTAHLPTAPTLQSIRPRNPSHKLFSASKNFLQRFFTHLTAPGLRAPSEFASQIQGASGRSLHSAARGSIHSNLSLPARHALRNNALQRQRNTFLPQAPGPVPPRFGGIAQVGLGTARNFSSTRPIFQHLAENVPIAGRALYEIDWDTEMRKEQARMRHASQKENKKPVKSKEMAKPTRKVSDKDVTLSAHTDSPVSAEDMEQYFPTSTVAPVTSYLLIPLAPTPTSRLPLPLDPPLAGTSVGRESALLPHLSQLGSIHASYGTHALRVSTLFARLDQANVWADGRIHCSAYSEGPAHHRHSKPSGIGPDEGVCTILRIEFVGWTKAEVRSVIGESGSGWCVLEEIHHNEEEMNEDSTSDIDSLSSSLSEYQPFETAFGSGDGTDISQSFVLPTIDITSSLNAQSSRNDLFSVPAEMRYDPWSDESLSSSSSPSSSYSDLSDIMMVPSFSDEWRGVNDTTRELEPREGMFY